MNTLAAEQMRIARQYQADTARRRGQRDGVVVTPVEVVDYIIRGAADRLQAQWGCGWDDPRVQVTDPFGGTGIFCARLMQTCGLTPDQLDDLYHHRMHVIELDPDAAAIADRNLRTVFEKQTGHPARKSIVTSADTFTMEDLPWLVDTSPAA